MSASTLSQRVRRLEERLGVRLLNRTTRSVAPTEAGERLLRGWRRRWRDVGDALDEVRGLRDSRRGPPAHQRAAAGGRVRAGADGRGLPQGHPQVDLDIVSESGFVDIVSAGFDAGVR